MVVFKVDILALGAGEELSGTDMALPLEGVNMFVFLNFLTTLDLIRTRTVLV